MKKRGQVTIFVIIGLILLLVVALFFVLRQSQLSNDPSTTKITHDFSHVQATYEQGVAQCLTTEGTRVIQEIFAHGGIYQPEEQGYFAIEQLPTKGSALTLGNNFLVPYWLQQKSSAGCRDDCSFEISIPPLTDLESNEYNNLPSIESQISTQLTNVVGPCLSKITFSSDYDVQLSPHYEVNAIIGEGTVTYELEREVNFTFLPNSATMTLTKTSGKHEAPVKQLYSSAMTLLDDGVLMNKTDTLPNAIKLIIDTYSMGQDPELPPVNGGTRFDTNIKTWIYPEVKSYLEERLADNIPLIQVSGSADQNIFTDPNQYSQVLYHTGPFKPDLFFEHKQYIPRLEFTYMYLPTWPIELKINPSNGYLIKPEGMELEIPMVFTLGFYDYLFYYDVVAPVMITIHDPYAFNGKGLTLMYAVEVGLVQNQPMLYANPPELDSSLPNNLFSQDKQQLDGYVSIQTINITNKMAVPQVDISYTCGTQAITAGTTQGKDALLTRKMPFCIGGILTGKLEGYKSMPKVINTIDDTNQQITLDMVKTKEFNIDMNAHMLNKLIGSEEVIDNAGDEWADFINDDGAGEVKEDFESLQTYLDSYDIDIQSGIWEKGIAGTTLDVDETLSVIFTRHTIPGETEDVQVKMINYSNKDEQTVELAPGTYDVEVFLIKKLGEGYEYENWTIPEDTITWGEGWFDGEEGEETLEELVFNDSIYLGGISLLEENALEVTLDNYANDTLEINYFKVKITDLEKHGEVGTLGYIDGYTQMYANDTKPRFYKEEPLITEE